MLQFAGGLPERLVVATNLKTLDAGERVVTVTRDDVDVGKTVKSVVLEGGKVQDVLVVVSVTRSGLFIIFGTWTDVQQVWRHKGSDGFGRGLFL